MSVWSRYTSTIGATLVGCSLLLIQGCTSSSDNGGQPGAGSSGRGDSNPSCGGDSSAGGNASGGSGDTSQASGESFTKRVLVEGLSGPWEISWGPDGWLWVTERTAKRVVRIRPSDGMLRVLVEIDEVRQDGGQDGLLGLAMHPQLLANTNQDFVYVAYSYDMAGNRRFKIRRYTYDSASDTLTAPLDLLTGLPASSDHNSGRLLIGPDNKLYYTIGDQGENQFERKCNPDRAQELPTSAQVSSGDYQSYQGKILRINLDGSIPDDNPELNGVRSHIFSFGHRNAEGIAFSEAGVLFADEHGPKSDDELNRIEAGKNYGWPYEAGFRDDQGYVYGNWSAAPDCKELPYSDYTIPASVPQQKESAWNDPNFTPPLLTFYTVEANYQFQDPKCGANAYICWPTIAPSSLEFYSAAKQALTGWSDSLLITSLKQGTVYRVPLSGDGTGISSHTTPLFKTTNRYRDLALNADGQTFYVITDNDGLTASVDGGATNALENKGSVLEFRAAPLTDPLNR
jgi:PQQ-dependent dehydrogenase (s-GDH family)